MVFLVGETDCGECNEWLVGAVLRQTLVLRGSAKVSEVPATYQQGT